MSISLCHNHERNKTNTISNIINLRPKAKQEDEIGTTKESIIGKNIHREIKRAQL